MQPVICPHCKQTTDLSASNPWRPFCSERCKMIDLGEWFEESRSIPAEAPADWDEPSESPDGRYQ